MAITFIPPERPFDEAEFKRRLADEYKMLQDKIDKIGGFRFTIKGWSVTAVIAASAAGGAAKSLMTVVTVSTGLAFMLYFFFLFELEQVKLSRLFGERLRKLEESFRRLDLNKGKTASAPIWAHEIVQASYMERLLAQRRSRNPGQKTSLRDQWTRNWRIHKQAHVGFYLLLVLLAFVLPLLPRYRDLWMHVRQWRSDIHYSAPVKPGPTSISPRTPQC